MHWLEISISVIAAIALFVHSLNHFSAKLKNSAGDKMNTIVKRLSNNKYKSFFLGFIATGIIQSSSAVISITVSFVETGLISFESSLPILLGSNLGTTVTAWLVSFDIKFLGSVLVILGFVLSYLSERMKFFSKPIFYLGLILFSLHLIGQNIEPIQESTNITGFLSHASNPFIGILIGFIITAITQSSSVSIGLAIILCGQGVMNLESAIGIIVGSNLGSTTTALIASVKMNKTAKKTALANLLFNFFGVLIYLPFYQLFADLIKLIDASVEIQAAAAHLIFNAILALLIMPFIKTVAKFLNGSRYNQTTDSI